MVDNAETSISAAIRHTKPEMTSAFDFSSISCSRPLNSFDLAGYPLQTAWNLGEWEGNFTRWVLTLLDTLGDITDMINRAEWRV